LSEKNPTVLVNDHEEGLDFSFKIEIALEEEMPYLIDDEDTVPVDESAAIPSLPEIELNRRNSILSTALLVLQKDNNSRSTPMKTKEAKRRKNSKLSSSTRGQVLRGIQVPPPKVVNTVRGRVHKCTYEGCDFQKGISFERPLPLAHGRETVRVYRGR